MRTESFLRMTAAGASPRKVTEDTGIGSGDLCEGKEPDSPLFLADF